MQAACICVRSAACVYATFMTTSQIFKDLLCFHVSWLSRVAVTAAAAVAPATVTAFASDALAALFLYFSFFVLRRPAQVGSGTSLWYGSVVRGDVNHVVIGAGSSVGDSAVLHVAGFAGNKPTIVGSNVVIGACVYTAAIRYQLVPQIPLPFHG